MIELKPCPFCGEIPQWHRFANPNRVWIECGNRYCGVRPQTKLYNTLLEAVEEWNRRTQLAEEIEKEFMKICEAQMKKES